MSYLDANRTPERIKAAIGVALILAGAGYAALTMRGSHILAVAQESLSTFDVKSPPPPPTPPPEPEPQPSEAKEGKAAPENLRAKPTQIVAPKPRIVPPIPLPVKAAPIAGEGNQASAGAGDTPGPGTGAGGQGNGLGSGGSGNGTGSGGIATDARRISGGISDRRDFPREGARARFGRSVRYNLSIGVDGRVTRCKVVESSGLPDLDSYTCDLIKKRLFYEPARDANGKAVPGVAGWLQEWFVKD